MRDARPVPVPPTLLTSREAALLLRVHPKHLYRLLRRGLPGHRIGGEWRFVREELLSWGTEPSTNRASTTPTSTELPPPIVAANGDWAIEILLAQLATSARGSIGFLQSDRAGGLAALEKNMVLAAGAHGPASPKHVAGRPLVRLDLVDREVGVAFRKKSDLRSLDQLASLRLASRPKTAGIRTHLDRALRKAGMDPDTVHEGALELASHRDVVLSIVRRETDVGPASRAWATRAGLEFLPLTSERYGLVLFAEHLGDPRVVRLGETAQTTAYRRALSEMSGYDTKHTGALRHLAAG